MAGLKTRNGGRWTEARFHAFVKGALRTASMKWQPINDVLKNARTGRGEYLCKGCGNIVPATTKDGRKRIKNVHVDHIDPVIDPDKGFESWDKVVERLFVEEEKMQLLCSPCHKVKTDNEKEIAKLRRLRLKQQNEED